MDPPGLGDRVAAFLFQLSVDDLLFCRYILLRLLAKKKYQLVPEQQLQIARSIFEKVYSTLD